MSFRSKDRLGEYIVEKLLSEAGGMSKIYLVKHRTAVAHRAIAKVNLNSQNKAATQDLLRDEVNVLRRLRHPSIVQVYPQVYRERVNYTMKATNHPLKPWFYVMEYIAGPSLDSELRRIKKFPLAWKIELFYRIIITINYMHQVGLAHCDLKPSNIVFRTPPRQDEPPVPVLVDFGSASPVNQIKEKIATVRYASPEIVAALNDPDPRAHLTIRADKLDVWELGVLFYEIITGEALFQGNTQRVKTTILRGEIKRVANQRLGISPSFDRLLLQMLKRNPADRPPVNQIIVAIEERIAEARPPRVTI